MAFSFLSVQWYFIFGFNTTNALYREIDQLKRKEASLIAQNQMIVVEIERLSRADRIKNIATTEIEMVTPLPETLAVVIDSKVLAVE